MQLNELNKAFEGLTDVTEKVAFIEQNGWGLLDTGDFATLKVWVEALPIERFHQEPAILHLKGAVMIWLGKVTEALLYLKRAMKLYQVMETIQVGLILADCSIAHRLLGDYQQSLNEADKALNLIGNNDSPLGLLVQSKALRAKANTLYHEGDIQTAISCATQALDLFGFLGRHQDAARMSAELGMCYLNIGVHSQALDQLTKAAEYWKSVNSPSGLAYVYNNIGVLYSTIGNHEQAIDSFEKAIRYARKSDYARLEAASLASLGDVYAVFDAKAAKTAYASAEHVAKRIDETFIHFYALWAAGKLARLQGDLFTAKCKLDQAKQLIKSSGYEWNLCKMEDAQVALTQGDLQTTLNHYTQAILSFEGQPLDLIQAKINLAYIHHLKNNQGLALEGLVDVFSLAATLEDEHQLVVIAQDVKSLLVEAANHATIGPQVKRLLTQIKLYEQRLPTLPRLIRQQQLGQPVVPITPAALRIQTLGDGRVLVQDKPLDNKLWTNQRRARQVFFRLLAAPNGLSRSALAAIFWPESPPERVTVQLGHTLNKIRRAFGDKRIVIFDSSTSTYRFNRDIVDYHLDVETFLKALKRSASIDDKDEKASILERAVGLYQGQYLPDADGTWVQAERESLEQSYTQAIIDLIKIYLEDGDYNAALRVCRKALREIPFFEEAHRQAMKIYDAVGERGAIVRQYQHCQQVIKSEFNAPVSNQTQHLYKALMN